MMPVNLPAEPWNFNEHFWKTPHQTPDGSWRRTLDYWTRARDDLCDSYNKRCVYSCFVIEPIRDPNGQVIGGDHSIDHFVPKSLNPAKEAFEWNNLRWCWSVINNIKGNSRIPIDPTQLTDMVVELDEDTRGKWMVIPASNLNGSILADVQDTIEVLGLNSRPVVNRRTDFADDFINNIYGYSDQEMANQQPFVFSELRRLGRI